MCLSKNTVHTGINSVVLAFCSKAACIVNVCTHKALNCYFFYFLLRILWLQLTLIASCRNQGLQNSSNHAEDVETVSTANITLDSYATESNPSEVQPQTLKRWNKVCNLIWKEDSQNMQQGPVLQCHKTRMYQNQFFYTCTFGNGSVCRNASDSPNESGGLRSFFLIINTKISFDTIQECVFNCQ